MPVSCKIVNPIDGLSVCKILINSSLILSQDTIEILSDCLFIDSIHSLSIGKRNFEEKYAARIILNGSSENVSSGSKGVLKIFFSIFKIVRYVKQNNIDTIYTNTSIILASGISAFSCKVPNYVHIHEIPNNNFYLRIMGFLISKFSSKIIVVSKSVKSHWSKYISKPLTHIYNGVPKINIEVVSKRPSKKIKFLTIARLLPYKGHKYIIEIANYIKKKNIDSEFIFLGDTFKGYESYENELKQMSKDLGIEKNILFKGFDSNISKYMNQSDFLLHGAINPDPLPTVIFEAIQHELPVISTCIGGPVEILDHGNGGLLIPFDDAFMASEEIAKYIFNKKLVGMKKQYSTNYIKKQFSEEKFNKKTLKFFNE